jgi:hypothetical protein
MITAKNRLFGADKKIGGDLTTIEGREQYNKDIISELTKGGGAELAKLAETFISKDYSGPEFEALAVLAGSNSAISDSIISSAKAARAEGGEANVEKSRNLLALDRELKSVNNPGGSKYLGVLEILTESLANLKLYQEQ